MAVSYDIASSAGEDFGVTTVTTPSFTIANVANRMAGVCMTFLGGDPGTISSVLCGTASGSLVTGASGNDAYNWLRIYKATSPATGSQTASATWTTAQTVSLSAVVANGASDINGGNYAQAAADNVSVAITSNAGDLTFSINANDNAGSAQTTNRTKRVTGYGCVDTGPGTAGPITHTWTLASTFNNNVAGANFVAAGGGGGGGGAFFTNQFFRQALDRVRAIGAGWKRHSDGRLLVPAYPMHA